MPIKDEPYIFTSFEALNTNVSKCELDNTPGGWYRYFLGTWGPQLAKIDTYLFIAPTRGSTAPLIRG